MTPATTWIEHGSDGRRYFVRKKTKLPSASELLVGALLPRRRDSLPFTRAFQRDHHIHPAPVSNYLALIPPFSAPPATQFDSAPILLPNTDQPSLQPQSLIMYQYPTQPPLMQERTNTQPNVQSHTLKPEPQHFTAPHPRMYPVAPYPPPSVMIQAQPPPTIPTAPAPHIFRSQPLPHGIYPAGPLPAGARVISPPRFPTADDMKYNCRVCGRFRSSRYHYQHPIPPGQLPGETVCRRCRDAATDSEEDSSDSRYEKRRQRAVSRSRGRSRSRNTALRVVSDTLSRHRVRSLSRIEISDVEDDRRNDRSYSRSSSFERKPLRILIDRGHRRRGRSSSAEIFEHVRYIDERHRSRPTFGDEIVYVEDVARIRPRSMHEEVLYDADVDHEYPRRTRVISRPATPISHIIRSRYSDPIFRESPAVERREYHDGPTSAVVSTAQLTRLPRPISRPSSRVRYVSSSEDQPWIERRSSEIHEDYYNRQPDNRDANEEEDWYAHQPRRVRRGRHRSRSRESNHNEGPRRPSWLSRAPTPPDMARSSSLGYMEHRPRDEEVEVSRTAQHVAVDGGGRPTTVARRRRSRSRSRTQSVGQGPRASRFLRPGDNVTVIGRQGRVPQDDYETYDREGMRIRVREI